MLKKELLNKNFSQINFREFYNPLKKLEISIINSLIICFHVKFDEKDIF